MPATRNEKGDCPLEAGEAAAREVVGQIEVHVGCRLGGQLRDFQLLVRENGLVLQGHAQTYYAKQLAQHVVMQTTGLPILANEIEVGFLKRRERHNAVLHLQGRRASYDR